jgi:hypothetical protein
MAAQVMKPASSRQLAYRERLRAELGENPPEIRKEMSGFEASRLISELGAESWKIGQRRKAFTAEALESYHLFTEIAEKPEQVTGKPDESASFFDLQRCYA